MSNIIKSIKSCPTFKKEVITFNKKDKKVVKTVDVSDCYLVTFNNGNSIAVSSKDLRFLGINIPEKDDKVIKVEENFDDNVEDFDDVDTIDVNIEENDNELVNGSEI